MNIGLFGSYFNLILDKIGSNSDNVTLFTVFFLLKSSPKEIIHNELQYTPSRVVFLWENKLPLEDNIGTTWAKRTKMLVRVDLI